MSAKQRFKDGLDATYAKGFEAGKMGDRRSFLTGLHEDSQYEAWAYSAGHADGAKYLERLRQALRSGDDPR